MAQVDHPVINERSAIVDADHGRALVPEVGDAHFCSKGKSAVGRRHRAALVNLTVGREVAVKTGALPALFAGHHSDQIFAVTVWRQNDAANLK